MGVLTQQPQGAAVIDRANPLSRDLTFLWTGSNPFQDLTGDAVTVSSANGQVIFNRGTERGLAMFSTTSGTVTRTFFKTRNINTSAYTTTIGAVFRVARFTGTTYVFGIVNALSYYQRIGINDTGNVTVDVATAPSTVITLVSDNTYAVGDWLSVVVTVVSGSIVFYVNGVKQTQTYTGTVSNQNYPRIEWGVSRGDSLLCFAAPVIWDETEVNTWVKNPWQLFKQTSAADRLLYSLIPDFTAELAPPTRIRSTYLTTASKYDSTNPITRKLLFASSPAHGNTDGVNPNTTWTNSSGIQVVPGRGGPAWVYGRAQSSSSTGLSKQISNTNWSMLSVFSAEVNNLSQITSGHYLAGPSFGSSSVPRLLVYNNGRMGLVTLNNSIDVDTVTITPQRVNTIAVTSDGNFTRFYLNGKLVHTSSTVFNSGGSVTYQPQRIFTTDIVAGTGLRPWYIYLSALWERPLLEHEVVKLSQDPFQLFKRPDTTNNKILSGQYKYVETDANGRWIPYTEQPAYVNHSDLPRAYIPVNKGHPLANRMLYCTTPSHGSRDAYHQDLQWLSGTGADFASSYNYGIYSRYGLAWRMKGYQIRRTFYFTQGNPSPRLQLTNYTMVQFLSIEQDNYPIVDGDRSLMGFGYANALHMYISRWGEIYLAYPYLGSSRTARQYSGSQRIPLRKLVAVACVATTSDISLYIDGRLVGNTTALNSTLLPFDLQETGGGGAYVNALGNWAFSFNHSMLHVYLSATWRRALSQNEIASFSQNPGQIFEHYEKFKRIYPEATPEQFFNKFFLFFG